MYSTLKDFQSMFLPALIPLGWFFIPFFFSFGLPGLRCCRSQALSSCSERGCSLLRCTGFSLRWLLMLQSPGSRRTCCSRAAWGLSGCGFQTPEHRLRCCGTGLSCSAASGIFLDQGPHPCPALAGGFLTAEPPGRPQAHTLFIHRLECRALLS